METKDFFQEALELLEEPITDRSQIDKFYKDGYLKAEERRLRFYLMERDPTDRKIISEMIVDRLLIAYYRTRRKVDGFNSQDINRNLMFFYERIIVVVAVCVLKPLNIKLDEEFVKEWKLKTDHFPFDDFLFNGKQERPFLEEAKKKAGGQNQTEEEFTHYHKDDEQKATLQFERLVNGGFFSSDTTLDDWLYVYGVKGKTPNKKPLDWKKTQKELGYLVRCIWQDTDTKKWVTCERVFTVKGKKPNTKSMRTDLSAIDNGYKNRPKTFDKLDEVLALK